MENIQKEFLCRVIPDFLSWEYDMPYIQFVFDDETLQAFSSYLDEWDSTNYYKGLKSIESLTRIQKEEEGLYPKIVVHDSKKFFSLLDKIVEAYKKRPHCKITPPIDFLRSIWLRMGVEDVRNVEEFLEKQLVFLRNDALLPEYKEIQELDEDTVLAYRIHENPEYFETNQNIVFSIRKSSGDIFDGPFDYDFPSIHFALCLENGEPTCYLYGIQNSGGYHDKTIQQEIQPIRKSFRNKNVSYDILISLQLFLDFLYTRGVSRVKVPALQVFNYPYHEHLSKNIANAFSGYSKEDQEEIESLWEKGDRSDKVLDYMHTKRMVQKFVDKEDLISQNKTERLLSSFYELQNKTNTIEIRSEAFGQSDCLEFRITGDSQLFQNYPTKKMY